MLFKWVAVRLDSQQDGKAGKCNVLTPISYQDIVVVVVVDFMIIIIISIIIITIMRLKTSQDRCFTCMTPKVMVTSVCTLVRGLQTSPRLGRLCSSTELGI